ncbi:uncharacterized protein F4822DRAFT_439836 [Hypoxylon trugodes]|uniref:uncharacterized protein n=1 Tax=Hypoxylon trugodes TaxID=326681 RepID=UPI00219E92B0|nr:uncharacterized protein F4822DRAFT_439836 [Hypoxylon trugodes]KAI1394055.1 hypothetical protein F4822DRAFT_439836 [Hypoxylon trugodes]
MKFSAILAFATAAVAAPWSTEPWGDLECTPPAYACKPDFTGWLVCNVDGWFIDGGNCDGNTWCQYIDGLPYCV